MLKKNRGFTLIEVVASLSLMLIIFLGIFYLLRSSEKVRVTASDLSEAQVTANDTMIKIEQVVRYAKYVNIEYELPPLESRNASYMYIYNSSGIVYQKPHESSQVSISPGNNGYEYHVKFDKVGEKIIKVTVTVFKGSNVIYKLSNNYALGSVGDYVIGQQSGECISYQLS